MRITVEALLLPLYVCLASGSVFCLAVQLLWAFLNALCIGWHLVLQPVCLQCCDHFRYVTSENSF